MFGDVGCHIGTGITEHYYNRNIIATSLLGGDIAVMLSDIVMTGDWIGLGDSNAILQFKVISIL